MASCRTKLSGGRILVQKERGQLNPILKPYWTHTLCVLTHDFWHRNLGFVPKPGVFQTHTEPGLNPYFARINSLFLLMVLVGMAANVCMVREGASWTRDDNEIHHTLIFHGLKPKEQQLVFFQKHPVSSEAFIFKVFFLVKAGVYNQNILVFGISWDNRNSQANKAGLCEDLQKKKQGLCETRTIDGYGSSRRPSSRIGVLSVPTVLWIPIFF
jgi:hypothetical protein